MSSDDSRWRWGWLAVIITGCCLLYVGWLAVIAFGRPSPEQGRGGSAGSATRARWGR
jgi:hypothetical protein